MPKEKRASRMRGLLEHEMPRERLLHCGASDLTTAELLAVILGSGTKGQCVLDLAATIQSQYDTLEQLAEATVAELCAIKGLGRAKALQLHAALALSQRMSRQAPSKQPISQSIQAYEWLKERLEGKPREVFAALLQDVRGRALRLETVSIGTLSQALVHPREVFHAAIRHHAASIILAHNHPSGDPTPSPQDIRLTRMLVEAGSLLGIPIRDHLVIGSGCYVSMRDEGLAFFSNEAFGRL